MDGLLEFMDEDDLLREFHRAGIFLPGEREQVERTRLWRERQHDLARMLLNDTRGMQGSLMAASPHYLQQAHLGQFARDQSLQQSSPLSGLLGGLGLFGGMGR